MKSFKKFVAEVAEPKSAEEKRFKDQHEYEVIDHPVADPAQHTGDIGAPGLPKQKAKRKADQEGSANYDKAYLMKRNEEVNEGEMVKRDALDKASAPSAAGKKAVTLKKAPWDKKEELSPKQKKIDHNKNGKIDGQDLAMIRAKKKDEACSTSKKSYKEEADLEEAHSTWEVSFKSNGHKPQQVKARNTSEAIRKASKKAQAAHNNPKQIPMHKDIKKVSEEVELDETTTSALKRPVTVTGPDGKTRTVMRKARVDRTDDRGQDQIQTRESVEQIDEAVSFKKGPVRLGDGKQVMVSAQDAKLLNQMFKDLSPANQRKMQKVAMMDKAGFDEIVGFAREAL